MSMPITGTTLFVWFWFSGWKYMEYRITSLDSTLLLDSMLHLAYHIISERRIDSFQAKNRILISVQASFPFLSLVHISFMVPFFFFLSILMTCSRYRLWAALIPRYFHHFISAFPPVVSHSSLRFVPATIFFSYLYSPFLLFIEVFFIQL